MLKLADVKNEVLDNALSNICKNPKGQPRFKIPMDQEKICLKLQKWTCLHKTSEFKSLQ